MGWRPPGKELGLLCWGGGEAGRAWLFLSSPLSPLSFPPPTPQRRERGEIPSRYCKSKCEQLVSSLAVRYWLHFWVYGNKS